MKFLSKAILFFFIFLLHSIVHADQCGTITTWTENDIQTYFLLDPGHLNNDDSSFTGFYIDNSNTATNSCAPNKKYSSLRAAYIWETPDWNMSISIRSFGDPAAGRECYQTNWPKFPQGDYSGGILEQGLNYNLVYTAGTGCGEPTKVEKMTLQGVYGGCYVAITGWSRHWAYNDPQYDDRCVSTEDAISHFKQRFQQAKTMIDNKYSGECHPPSITLYPYKSGSFLFELNLLKDKAFLVEIRDDDGVVDDTGNWKIDLSTLQILVNGHDITGHFLDTLVNQGLLNKASVSEVDTLFQALIRLDPEKLMTTHNLFAIAENGWATITLGICDVDGLCSSKEHKVYFGPFTTFSKVERGKSLNLIDWTEGNTGKECEAETYLAIWNEMSEKFWFFTFYGGIDSTESDWILFENDLVPWRKIPSIAAGSYGYDPKVPIVFYSEKISGNNLYYYMGVLDKSSNEWAIDYGPVE